MVFNTPIKFSASKFDTPHKILKENLLPEKYEDVCATVQKSHSMLKARDDMLLPMHRLLVLQMFMRFVAFYHRSLFIAHLLQLYKTVM